MPTKIRTRTKRAILTAIEGVPGIRPQHVGSVLHDGASLWPLRPRLFRETDVTGQGLGDVVHSVHLKTRLIWKRKNIV